MLLCIACGCIALSGRDVCGLCGGKLVESNDRTTQVISSVRSLPVRRSRAKPLAILTISIAVLTEGIILIALPISAQLTALGWFVMIIGALMAMIILGLFDGVPYRSRYLNRVDRELKRRERQKYSD